MIEPIENYDFKKVIFDKIIKYFYSKYIKKNKKFSEIYDDIFDLKEEKIFCFEININNEILKKINYLKDCLFINLSSMELDESHLSFLEKSSFPNIEFLYLSNNKIKNINLVIL